MNRVHSERAFLSRIDEERELNQRQTKAFTEDGDDSDSGSALMIGSLWLRES